MVRDFVNSGGCKPNLAVSVWKICKIDRSGFSNSVAARAGFLVLGFANHVNVEVLRVAQPVVKLKNLDLAAGADGKFGLVAVECHIR